MSTVDHLLVITAEHTRLATQMVRGRAVTMGVVLNPAIRTRKHTPSARDMETADRLNARADVVFYFRPGVDVRVEDIMTVDRTVYRITALLPPSLPHHLKAFAKEMQRAGISIIVWPSWPNPGGQTPGQPADTPTYVWDQPTAAAVWTIPHNLGFRPSVTAINTGSTELIADVLHLSENLLTITFAAPTAGQARLT